MHINYKQLLKKYMEHVISCEGASLLDSIEYDNILSAEDKRILHEIEAEVRSDQPKSEIERQALSAARALKNTQDNDA